MAAVPLFSPSKLLVSPCAEWTVVTGTCGHVEDDHAGTPKSSVSFDSVNRTLLLPRERFRLQSRLQIRPHAAAHGAAVNNDSIRFHGDDHSSSATDTAGRYRWQSHRGNSHSAILRRVVFSNQSEP